MSLINEVKNRRHSVWAQAQRYLDDAEKSGRGFNAEADATWTRYMAELDQFDQHLGELERDESRNASADVVRAKYRPAAPDAAGQSELDRQFRNAILRNDTAPIDVTWHGRSGVQPGIERRDLTTTGLRGTTFWNVLERHLVEGSAILAAGATLITTDSGEPLKVPKSTANSAATIITEGSTITESDPTLGTADLLAHKYAFRVQITRELAEDASFDVASYLAAQAGDALANGAGAHFVTGAGTTEPTGIITGATLGKTGSTGVAGAFTADNLIDLYHSVAEPYARSASAAWLMANATLGAVRKLKDPATGVYLFDVNAPAGTGASGSLLGRPVFVDPTVPAVALSAKSVLFGDVSRYWVRSVRGLRFERSDHAAWSTDQIDFRAVWRADGNLVDTSGAVKHFSGAAT